MIVSLASKQRDHVNPDNRAPTKHRKDDWKPMSDEQKKSENEVRQKNIANRKTVKIDKNTRMLMLAVSARRTQTNYGKRHFCRKHGVMVDRKHIDSCDILSTRLKKPVTHYN